MGRADGLALRFVRSWDDRSGARYAELELSIDGQSHSARAWRRHDTVEVDLTSTDRSATPGPWTWFVEGILVRLQPSPLCAGASRLRLRMPAEWTDHVEDGAVAPSNLRSVFVCDKPPRIRPQKRDLKLLPVSELGRALFMSLFQEVMSSESLGLRSQLDINRLANSLWRNEPVEGVESYKGFAVFDGGIPIALFFTHANPDGGAWLGFAGLVPRVRRGRLAAAATGYAVEHLRQVGGFPITMEIDAANRRSLRMAERRCGPARGLVAVYDWPV